MLEAGHPSIQYTKWQRYFTSEAQKKDDFSKVGLNVHFSPLNFSNYKLSVPNNL